MEFLSSFQPVLDFFRSADIGDPVIEKEHEQVEKRIMWFTALTEMFNGSDSYEMVT